MSEPKNPIPLYLVEGENRKEIGTAVIDETEVVITSVDPKFLDLIFGKITGELSILARDSDDL